MEAHTTPSHRLSKQKKIGYWLLIALGVCFSLATFGSLGNLLGWLAAIAAVGCIGVPATALLNDHPIARLPLGARVLLWLAVLAAACFVILMTLVVWALRNNLN